ncbi:hypothetical protein Vadar_031469 [Vaccinium darrowii]|uniref:Uncharacterized protein n=1 Tax=Vaccinium darrowii TaxID=229202 RepID=A0ACB7YIE6_9ERIC|nr:hypothetical protein Vadar_031469 [Vaccinium darrowii]
MGCSLVSIAKCLTDGIDRYLENVGGKMLGVVLLNMRLRGCILMFVMFSHYNLEEPEGVHILFCLIPKQGQYIYVTKINQFRCIKNERSVKHLHHEIHSGPARDKMQRQTPTSRPQPRAIVAWEKELDFNEVKNESKFSEMHYQALRYVPFPWVEEKIL